MAIRATVTASTHPGLERAQNQDMVGVGGWRSGGTLWRPWRQSVLVERPLLCIIADGMGGHSGGDTASASVVNYLSGEADKLQSTSDVALAVIEADRQLYALMETDSRLRRMGTTVVGLTVSPERLIWFNVGDSRLYQYRDGFLRQVSVDDVPQDDRAPDGLRVSHVITQSLGGGDRPARLDVHIGVDEPVLAPSRWLLCSDGLTDMLSRAEMEAALQGDDLSAWVALFAGAMEAGAKDNVSIVLVTIEPAAGG